jgi:hypothetical protein
MKHKVDEKTEPNSALKKVKEVTHGIGEHAQETKHTAQEKVHKAQNTMNEQT